MGNLSSIELLLSFVITWIVVMVPPAIIRFIRRKPLSKGVAITLAIVLYFANIILFTAMGSQSKSHGALVIGAIFCYYVLRWQTNSSAARSVAEQRKALGYRSAAALSKHLALPCAKCLRSRGAFFAPTALRSSKRRWPTMALRLKSLLKLRGLLAIASFSLARRMIVKTMQLSLERLGVHPPFASHEPLHG